jgi:hypothetical protein
MPIKIEVNNNSVSIVHYVRRWNKWIPASIYIGRKDCIPIPCAMAHELGHLKSKEIPSPDYFDDKLPSEITAWGYALASLHPSEWDIEGIATCLFTYCHSEEDKRIVGIFITKITNLKRVLTADSEPVRL